MFNKDFKVTHSKDGICYSFNFNSSEKIIQSVGGTDSGLRLLIDVDEKEYSHLSFNGMERYGSGLNIILHDWHEVPQLGLAVGVPTGFVTYISTEKQVRTMTNEPPWSSCLTFNETTNERYSLRNCLQNCKTMETVQLCGCRLWYQPGDQIQCGVAQTSACVYYLEFCNNVFTHLSPLFSYNLLFFQLPRTTSIEIVLIHVRMTVKKPRTNLYPLIRAWFLKIASVVYTESWIMCPGFIHMKIPTKMARLHQIMLST